MFALNNVQLLPKPKMSGRGSNIICAVVEGPDHHVVMNLYGIHLNIHTRTVLRQPVRVALSVCRLLRCVLWLNGAR